MNDNEEWGEIEPVETADDFGEVEPLRWEDGDGGEERLPEGERNQWGGNLRNEGRRVLLRRDKDGKVNGYSTTSSMLVRHDDGKFAVVPTVVGGKELSQEEAVKHYAETGEHWGMADDEESAQKMAQEVHDTHMKGNQAKWNDWLHEHWDEVSDDIRNDRGMAYEHKKRTAPDKITLMERLANDDTDDERKKKEQAHHWQEDYSMPSMSSFGMGVARPKTARKYDDKAQMDDLAEIATEAGLADWQVKRIRSESKTPEEMREALKYVAGNRPVRDGEEPEKETAGWRSVPKTIVNTAGKMAAGFINLVGTVAGGVDEDARHAFMADDPMAKKEGETFDAWLGRVNIDEKVKRMAKRDPAVRENLEKYFRWEAPVAGKEGMHQEHSIMVQNGREGTGVGNSAIRDAKRLRNWLDEKTPVGNSGSSVVDWLEGAASGIAQFAYLGPTMIAMSAADSYQQTHSTALESGKGGGAAEGLAAGSALFDGAMTAAFYYAPFRRWMNGKGIVPVQPVEKFTFGGLSKAMGRFNAKREFLNQGVAAIEAGGIMGVQGAGDTAFRQLASGQDLDLGEITIEGLKGVRDGVAIGAIMGAGRILNARIKGARDYEKVVRAAAQTPDGRLMLASLNPDGMMDLKRFIQEGIDVAKAHEKPAADFEADTRGNVAEGRAPAPDWKPTEATMRKFQELCDKAGLPPDAKLASDVLFDPRVANYLGDTLNAKFRNAANAQPEHAAIPEKPIIDAETGKVVSPSQALAKRVNREFGVEPAHFDLPQTADGKPGLVPMKWRDNKTGKENTSNLAHDPKTGVTIMEEEDGTFSVHNDTGDSDGAATLGEAVEKARELALMGQYTVLDRERKRRVIENERAAKYGKRNVVYFNTMADAAQAFANGIARDGSFLGLTNANQLRNPVVQDRDAFYTPDGTAVVILDNVHEVGDIPRILAHEIVGHGGPNAEFGGRTGAQAVFAENIRAKEFDAFKKQVSDGLFPKLRGTPEEVNRNLGEVFAHYASVNLDKEPSKLDKLVNSVNKAARKIGLRKTYSAADVRTMMAKWRDAAKGEGGTALNLADGSPRFDFFAPDKPAEAPGERGEVQTGKETSKPTEAPTGDSGASGAVSAEPRRLTSAEEVVATAKTPFNDAEKATLKDAADVSAIDSTDEMPAQTDFLSILSNDAPVVRLNPAKVDRSDAVLPNMKKDANRTSGITKPLSGEWHPTMGGIGAAWLTKDGKLVVITGRHRSELAERKGKSMLYYLYREADGFTKDDALIYDAVANIHDEKGTINDYLGFLDRINPTREQAEKAGILSGKGLVAWSLYKDATEAVRSATAMDGNPGEGQISPQQATVIAEAAPRDADKRNPSIQRQLLKTALGGMRGKAFDMYARIRADELSRTPLNENLLVGEQMDLFSSPEDQAADILAQRQSQYRTKKAQGYQTVAQNLRAALNKEGKLELTDEYAKDLGVTDKSDKKQLEAAYDKAVERANYWENTVRLDDTDKAAMDAEINAAADAKAKRLAELKAKREAVKSGKPKVVVSKNATTTPADETKPPAGETKPAAGETKRPSGETKKADSETKKPVSETQKPALETKNAVSETKTGKTEMSKATSKTPSIKMKDEAAEKKAKAALDAIDFDTSDLSADSTILSGDEVRKTMPGYNRLDWSTHVDRTGYVGPRLEAQFQRLLKERNGKGDGTVVFLAGGNGAGKSTVAARIGDTHDFAIDSTLGNLEVAKKQIDAILANGQTPEIHFVYRTPGQALEGIAQRVMNGGHIVSPLSFANSHVKSRENLRLLSEAYGDKIHIHIYDNSVEGAPEITLEQLEAKRKIDHAKIRESANYYLGHLRERAEASGGSQGGVAGSVAKGEAPQVDFDTPDFDPEKFGKLVTGVGKLVDVLVESGHKDFKALATYIYEQDAAKYERAKPVLQDIWNAVARARNLPRIADADADSTFKTIEAQTKEVEDGADTRGQHGVDAAEPATSGGEQQPGGVLADRPVREQNPDGRVDGQRSGDVPGLGDGVAKGEASERGEDAGGGTPERAGAVADSAEPKSGEREDGRDSGEDGHNTNAHVKKRAKKAADSTKPNPKRRDFVMTKAVEEAILEKKTAQRVRNNLEAIKLIRELKAKDYAATPEEQATLAKFVGWGGLREDVFGYGLERAYDLERSGDVEAAKRHLRREGISQSAYDLHKELRSVLNDSEYESAKASASTAFYTPVYFVEALHDNLRHLGVKGGRFLGPSAGVGNFASASGEYEKPVNWQFVEKDAMTGEMLKALFPNQRVTIGGFEDTKFPDGFFDFAIDNVPYADVPINDRSLSSKMFKIHDYFFAKTLSKLRPGGVMAFLTSTGTLDKTSPILRQFLTEHGGKIVGAVRLPNGFFSENAGTDVASDLVIVQKVQGRPDNSAFEKGVEYGKTEEWVRRKGRIEKPLTYNGYFQDHPEQIVGKMEIASGQFGPTLKYTMPDVLPGDLSFEISKAIGRALGGIDKDALLKSAAVAEKQDHTPIYDEEGLRQGNVTMKDGKPFIKSGEMLEPITLPNDRTLTKELAKRFKSPTKIMEGLLDLRKAMREVIDAQMSDNDMVETDLAPLLAKLNEVYDAFVKKNGTLHDKWVSPFVLLDKADGNRLLALERVVKDENGKPKVVKSDIFTKRVISRGQRATKADTPKDALVISYSEMGAINVPRIAELLGVDHEEAIAKLKEGGDAFENPQTGLLEPSWEYLSGRVRAKLAAARAAVDAGEESYRANIEALEKVQPPMVRLEDAEIKFGATWVDPECMKDFLRDAFGAESMRINLGKNEVTGQWNVEFGRVMNEDPWGETSWSPQEFVSRVLNHGSMNHYDTDPVDKKRYLNERRTEGNKLAAEKLHHAFSQFIQSSDKWASPMYERYNAVMTDMVEIKLPNNVLPFRAAGMSEATLGKLFEGGDPKHPKKGREYQSDVIARGVLGGNSLCLAHCVGAGKTLEMQSIGVLGRHLGLFKKPMYVVPNHMLEQFTNEFVEAFPNANILKMSEADVKPENRRAFFAQVANGDWDAIVVKHSTFSKKLAMSDEYQKEFIEAQRRDLIEAIAAMREAGEKISVDQATKKLERLEAKLEQLANAENHDSQIVPFEELGVDQLFVDEAHNFKGMPITTRQGRTGGLSQGDSQRAVDMQMKTQYVQSLHGGDRGVVFATGTPLSNAPVVEAYVMLKYLAPNKLEEQGLKHFDDFVDAFGRITTESEFSLDGKTVKEKEKVSAFVNIPELMKLLRSVVDIVNPDQLDIPRPKPKYHMIDVDMSPVQERIMEMVAREAATPPSREERNKYLTLTRIAKNACLTPRLLGFEDGGNKIVRAAAEIKRVYDETADNHGTQLVFTDIFNRAGGGTDEYIAAHIEGDQDMPYARGGFNLNEEIRDLLVASGIPKDEIAIIQDIDKSKGDKDANKGALFAKVRAGEVRVLIGSRPKMGEGTNVQERLAAIHLLHPGWKPSEDEQAIGRIIRFGNTYKEGQIFYYLTKGNANIGSYETKNHQLIGVKSKLIDQVMHGDDTVREIDMDESAMDRDMLMGLASGNKALMELIDVKKRVHKLELNTESTLTSARRNKDKAEANSRILERRREEFAKEQEGVKEWREKNEGKPFTLSTSDGRSIEKVKEMADYVAAQVVKQLTKDRYDRDDKTVLGDFNGVELVLAYDKWGDEKFRLAVPLLGVAREINYSGFIPDFSQGAMTAFKGKIFETVSPDFAKAYENSLADMDRQAKKMSADADKLQKDYEQMRDELIQLRTRQAELERAVTPLVIQAVENRKAATYGNWIITKPGSGRLYVANRESDAKSVSAPTVKELIPLMNAEDFASPRNAATKTIDLRPHLKPNSKGEYPHVDTLSAGQVDFDTPDLSPAEEAYSEAEDKTPTEKVMREVYGMTNDEIGTALKAAGMEPPKHVRKPDETAWKQAEALLSNPSYMAKLSRAVAKFPRNIADYENNALNVLFRQRQAAVNAAQSVVDGLKETLDAFDAIPKEERDTDFNEEQRKTASDYAEAKSKLAQAKSLMYETGLALTRSSSEAGRRLRSNRGLIDQTDYSYAGISGEVAAILGGADKITPEMDARIREIAGEFASLDDVGRDLATVRLKAHAEKIVEQIKNADKVRRAVERKTGDEVKRVMRNYNDALAQIEVGAAEVGGTLVGLSDQQYPAWGKWLRAIGEYHCFANPDITEEECINAIVEDISPFITTDANGVRDALTGFGHNFRQSRYEAQRMMNDLRSQSRLKRQIDWMDEHNTMPPLTGLVRDEPSDTTRNLQKQVQERKKEVPDAGRDERRLKGVLESAKTRVKNRIADLERAIETGEKIPGRDRTVPEDIELRELKKRKDELQKAYDELFKTEHGMTDEQRVKLAERLLGRELEHALADLDRARSGDFSKRPKRPGVESPTIDALRDRLNEVRGQIRELKNAKYEFGMTPDELNAYNARKMANREKAVARLAERIVRGDLRPQVKPQPPMPKEMQKRYDELAEQMSRAHRKLADLRREAADARKPKFVRFIGDAYRFVDGVWKMATASLDFTQVGNQTGSILMAHPKIVAENFVKTLSAFKNVANAENIELDILSDESVKEAVDNGWLRWKKVSDSTNRGERVELFDAIDKPFTIGGKAIRLTDIPFYGTAIANSDRLYATYINAASASLYSTIINDPKLFPGGATVFQKKMLCDMINVMNGSGTLSKGARRYAGKVFWAPGLVDSQLKRLLGYQIWHPWLASAEEDGSGTFKERATMSKIGLGEFVRSNLGALLLGGLLFALFATDDQKDEYAHAGFVKRLQMMVAPRIRHTQLDFTGGSVAFLRLGNRLATGAYETATGKQAKVRDVFSEVAHFAKGRLTPLVSNVFSAMSGKDYTGQDYGASELLLSFAPISLREAGKSIYENGIEDRAWGTAFLGAALTMFGVGKGTYRKDDYAVLSNRFLESKKEYDAIDKDDLIDDANRKVMLDSIIAENPLMRDEVREDIAADIAQIRKDEARVRKDEREGIEPDVALLSEIETGKAKLIEKIRAARRK